VVIEQVWQMAVYIYTARNAEAIVQNGTIVAETPRQARDQLRARGLEIDRLAPEAASAGRRQFVCLGRGVSSRHLTQFSRELSTLLAVGMPLLESLDTLSQQTSGPMLTVIQLLRERVAAGGSLAQAMQEQPGVFDDMCINMTETGEDTGNLEISLERLATFREHYDQLKGRIGTTMVYPTIVLVVAVSATIFLMTFVVPRILEPLIEQGQRLPVATIIVKGASDFLVAWWWLMLAVVAGVVGPAAALLRRPSVRLAWHRVQLRIPLAGDLIRMQAVVRIAVVMSALLRSGVVFSLALQVAQRSTRNLVMREALAECGRAVAAGADISVGLQRSGAFAPMVVQVFALGQQSGRLEETLDRLAADYDAQVATRSQWLASLLEPGVIIVLALVVLLIVLATVLPILEAGDVLG
jgi:general secretion pathway protein F